MYALFVVNNPTRIIFRKKLKICFQRSRKTVRWEEILVNKKITRLPVEVTTTMGDKFSFNFKLHEHTADPIKVSNLVSSVLATLDNEIKLLGETSNGDVLQGLAMALAIRSKIIHGADDTTPRLVKSLVNDALESLDNTKINVATSGNA